jgi:hypothetical protein
MVLSGCDDRRPIGPGSPDWGSDHCLDRTVGRHAWGVPPYALLWVGGHSCIRSDPVDIGVVAGQLPQVNDAARIVVGPESAAYRGVRRCRSVVTRLG